MHVCVILGVQGDAANGASAREEQVGLWRGVTGLSVPLQLDASGAGTGETRRSR